MVAPGMNDACPLCETSFEQGDWLVVVGHITKDGDGGLMSVHRNCILENVLGPEQAQNVIMREREQQ